MDASPTDFDLLCSVQCVGLQAMSSLEDGAERLVNALFIPLPLLLAQLKLFNFAGRGFGKIAKLYGLGTLKMRQVLAAESDDVLGGRLHPWLGHHKGLGHLTPALV